MVDQYGSEQYQQRLRLATELDLDGQQIQQLRNITQYGALDRDGELSVQDSAAGDFAGMEAALDGSQLAISGGRAHTSAHGELQLAGYQFDSGIPDSVLYQYAIDEGSGQTLIDTEAGADISLNFENWLSGSNYEGGYAVGSDGTDDRGLDGTLGTFGSNTDTNFAVEFVVATSESGSVFGVINSGGNANMAIAAATSNTWLGSSGPITFALRSDTGDAGQFLSVESSTSLTDGNLYHVIWNKTGNTAADQEIQINGSAESVVTNSDAFDETQVADFDSDMAYLARNARGSLDEYLAADLAVVRWYGDSLTEQQKMDLWERQPFA